MRRTEFGTFSGLTVVASVKPAVAERLLRPFANSARAHYTEQAVRVLVGASLVIFSAAMWQPKVFGFLGWVIVLSSAMLILTPWRWHQRFGTKMRPVLIRRMRVFAVSGRRSAERRGKQRRRASRGARTYGEGIS